MNVKLLLAASALAVVGAGWFAGAGATAGYGIQSRSASARTAAAAAQPELDLYSASSRLGVKAPTGVTLSVPTTSAEAGKYTLYVPAGYGLNPVAPAGTREGGAFIDTGSDFGFGDLKAADPAAYENTPQAQACAPGSHAAVWIMQVEFLDTEAIVPIYIDPTAGDEAALGAYKLQICLPLAHTSSPGGPPLGSRLDAVGLGFTRVTNPTSASVYVWRAFVSSPDVNGNPDPSTTYELRSDVPLPAKLSLAGRIDLKHHRALLSGRLTTPSLPSGGVRVSLYRRTGMLWQKLGSTTTSANGSYRFVHRAAKTATYGTEISAIGACNGPSTAPKGCVDETHGAIDSNTVRLVVRRHH
jgi:hypothetical protein